MTIKAKDLKKGFKYEIKEENDLFIYLGKTRYIGSTEKMAFKVKEEYLFISDNNEEVIYKNLPLKNVITEINDSIEIKKAEELYEKYILERDEKFRKDSPSFMVEIAKLLINPIVAEYVYSKGFKSAIEVIEDLHATLNEQVKNNNSVSYYNLYEKEPHNFKEDLNLAYIMMLYNIKYHVTKKISTDNMSKKKLEEYLFTNEALVEIIECIEEKKETKVDLKIFKHALAEAEENQEECERILKENEKNVIDFTKRHNERTTNVIKINKEQKESYVLYHLKTLFGDVVFLYCDEEYINKLGFINNEIINETIYKGKLLKKNL